MEIKKGNNIMYIFEKLQRYKYNLQKKEVKDEYDYRIENELPKIIFFKYKFFF